MKANELRIGNYHKFEGISIPRLNISSVNIDEQSYSAITGYGIYLVGAGKMNFDPIPLTEEWLLKFGFKNIEYNNFYLPRFSDYDIAVNENNSLLYFENLALNVNFKYVHQLQNLYFVLTGEELELNGEAFLK